jgi:hypothetical protein
MRHKDVHLETPWLRVQLVDYLRKLSSREWQEKHWGQEGADGPSLDEMLDFFDDSGVLAEPHGRLGFILADELEAARMMTLNSAIDAAISGGMANDVEIMQSQAWGDVLAAAREALSEMNPANADE